MFGNVVDVFCSIAALQLYVYGCIFFSHFQLRFLRVLLLLWRLLSHALCNARCEGVHGLVHVVAGAKGAAVTVYFISLSGVGAYYAAAFCGCALPVVLDEGGFAGFNAKCVDASALAVFANGGFEAAEGFAGTAL